MSQKTMYAAVNNSPKTSLSAAITSTETAIPLRSVSGIPPAPNLITIGDDDDAEVVKYNGISELNLTGCERGLGGTTAKIWLVDSPVYRAYTKYDHDTFKDNIEDLDENKLDKTGGAENATVAFTSAAQRVNLSSGEKIGVSFGKIAKFFADLKALAFLDTVGTSYITNGSVTNAKLDNMSAKTLKGNKDTSAAAPTDLSASDVRSILNVSDGADVTESALNGAGSETTFADADKIPFVDASASTGSKIRTIAWSTFKNLFGTVKSVNGGTPDSSGAVSLPTGSVSSAMLDSGSVTPPKAAAGVLPVVKSITLNTSWSGSGPYTHSVSVTGYTLTANSKVDIQPGNTVLAQLTADGVTALWIENINGTLTAYARGAKPTASLTIQVTVQEVTV